MINGSNSIKNRTTKEIVDKYITKSHFDVNDDKADILLGLYNSNIEMSKRLEVIRYFIENTSIANKERDAHYIEALDTIREKLTKNATNKDSTLAKILRADKSTATKEMCSYRRANEIGEKLNYTLDLMDEKINYSRNLGNALKSEQELTVKEIPEPVMDYPKLLDEREIARFQFQNDLVASQKRKTENIQGLNDFLKEIRKHKCLAQRVAPIIPPYLFYENDSLRGKLNIKELIPKTGFLERLKHWTLLKMNEFGFCQFRYHFACDEYDIQREIPALIPNNLTNRNQSKLRVVSYVEKWDGTKSIILNPLSKERALLAY